MSKLTGKQRKTTYTWLVHFGQPGPLPATAAPLYLGDGTELPVSIGSGLVSFAAGTDFSFGTGAAANFLAALGGTFSPSAHKSSHATGGSDAITPADIGAAESHHRHAAGTEALPGLSFADDTDTGIFPSDANTLALVTGGASRVLVTSTGKVSIGSATPTNFALFTVAKTLTTDGETGAFIDVNPGTEARGVKMGAVRLGGGNYPGIWIGQTTPTVNNYAFLGDGGGATLFNTPTGTNMMFRVNNINHMGLFSNGKVGVGTGATLPAAKFQVQDSGEQLRVAYDASNYSTVTVNSTGGVTFSSSGSAIIPWTFNGHMLANSGLTIVPAASATPAANGQLVFEATSNTQVTVKLKGSDGTVREVVLTLT
jgi:hypothetical protein